MNAGTTSREAAPGHRWLLATRCIRAVADGLVAASLGTYLALRGLDERQIGLVVTATLFGSAVTIGIAARRPDLLSPARTARITAALMVALGVSFALSWPITLLVVLALIGPLNPGGGDVSAFLPAEQAMIAAAVPTEDRPRVYGWLTFVASAGAAVGGLLTIVPDRLRRAGWNGLSAVATVFWLYAVTGAVVGVVYLTRTGAAVGGRRSERLAASRRAVRDMTLLFALDSAGGGLVLTSLIGVWLSRRFGFDLAEIGAALAAMAVMSAASSLLAARLVRRFGAVRTMVATHAPAQVLLIATAFAPNAPIAVGLLLARSLTSNLDVPARTAFVMATVTPEERAAAASYTNLPRALAAALTPAVAGWMLHRSAFGWPLIAAGLTKLLYDLLLYVRFADTDATRPTE